MTTIATQKVCCGCGKMQPRTAFRPRRSGGSVLSSQCRLCHNRSERRRRQSRRRDRILTFASRLRRIKNLDKLVALTRATCRQFGGVNRLAQQLQLCYVNGDSKTRASILVTIVTLLERCEIAEQEVAEEEKKFARSRTECSRSGSEVGDREALIASKFRAMIDVQKTAEGERTNVSTIADSQ